MVAAVLEARHEADGSGVSIDGGAAVALVDDSAAMLSRETPPVSAAGSGTTPRSGSVRTIGQFPPRDKKQRLGASDSDNDFQRTPAGFFQNVECIHVCAIRVDSRKESRFGPYSSVSKSYSLE